MSFAKIDHKILTDPKMTGLPGLARLLFIEMIIWASREETDGAIPKRICLQIGSKLSLNRLINEGIVNQNGKDCVVVNFLKYQTSKASIEATRAANALRKQRSREASHAVTPTIPSTENREQRTENREQRVKQKKPTVSKSRAKVEPKSPKWTTVPETWKPTEKHRADADRYGIELWVEIEKFRNWEFKVPKSSANQAFSSWLVKAYEHKTQFGLGQQFKKPEPAAQPLNAREIRERDHARKLTASIGNEAADRAKNELEYRRHILKENV